MADIEIHLYEGEITETIDAVEFPPPSKVFDEIPDITEAWTLTCLLVLDGEGTAAAIVIDDLFFVGLSLSPRGMLRVIHTPAADAFFDEHNPGWRHGLAAPINLN